MPNLLDGDNCIEVLFDKDLNYLKANKAACRQLNVEPQNLIGQNILQLYPDVIASKNHRNLLKALNGIVVNDFMTFKSGENYHIFYKPMISDSKVVGVWVKAVKV